MNDDLIKRSDAIGAITNHCENECYYRVDSWCPQCQREEFEEAIKAIPSADRPQEWIPCSERLPEENKRVLITTAWGYVAIGWIKQNIWSTDLMVNLQDFVLAWMPLPQPWKGADDEV